MIEIKDYQEKAIMKPYFASTESVPEKDFIKLLENPKNSVKC